MKLQKALTIILSIFLFGSCASSYKTIDPEKLSYNSVSEDKGVILNYRYNLLTNRYAVKEAKNGLKVIAVKIVNNSTKNLVFDKDIKLTYTNNSELVLLDNEQVYNTLKQGPAIYLLYLLLTPAKFTSTSNGQQTSSVPVGYVLGPGLALGNIAVASSANDSFKAELLKYLITGTVIKAGETRYGLVGVKSDASEAIKVKVD